MAIFIGVLLTLLSIGVVLYPFWKPGATFRRDTPTPDPEVPDEGDDLEAIYDAIQTLRLEHSLGNVPLELYREQLETHRRQAALALRRKSQVMGSDDDLVLEQEIMLARASLSPAAAGAPNGITASCTNCGNTVSVALPHCPECSIELGSVGQRDSDR